MKKRLLNKDEIADIVTAKKMMKQFIDLIENCEKIENKIKSLSEDIVGNIAIDNNNNDEQLFGISYYREQIRRVRLSLDAIERRFKC